MILRCVSPAVCVAFSLACTKSKIASSAVLTKRPFGKAFGHCPPSFPLAGVGVGVGKRPLQAAACQRAADGAAHDLHGCCRILRDLCRLNSGCAGTAHGLLVVREPVRLCPIGCGANRSVFLLGQAIQSRARALPFVPVARAERDTEVCSCVATFFGIKTKVRLGWTIRSRPLHALIIGITESVRRARDSLRFPSASGRRQAGRANSCGALPANFVPPF
jgi:hypothetical protein